MAVLRISLFLFVSSSYFCLGLVPQPEVTLPLGQLRGKTIKSSSGRDVYAFEGIPYAKPPTGKHRFKQSIPATAWQGIWDATRAPNMCMQANLFGGTKPGAHAVLGSEDCLYVNVYTPKLPADLPDGKLLDVIFHIHAGAFQVLEGKMWGPKLLLDRDVVYVNLNYRLGVLGFFCLEDPTQSCNNGLKDQNLALKWVNKYIAAFGGNPNKITINGVSAGGASVHYHILSPMSKGLFHKAIANSGAVMNTWALTKKPREKALRLAEDIGCTSNDTVQILRCLRERPGEQLVVALTKQTTGLLPMNPMGPVIETPGPNTFMDQQPIDLIKSKSFKDVPLLLSHTSDECAEIVFFMLANEKDVIKVLEEDWNGFAPTLFDFKDVTDPTKLVDVAQKVRKHYIGSGEVKAALPGLVQGANDRYFVNGIQEAAILHAENQKSPVYLLKFNYTSTEGYDPLAYIPPSTVYKGGVPHGYDSAFLFNVDGMPPITNYTDAMATSKTLIDHWMSFISDTPVPSWTDVKSSLPQLKALDFVASDPKLNSMKVESTDGLEFWNSLNLQENSAERVAPQSPYGEQ